GIRAVETWKPQMQARIDSMNQVHHAMDDDSLVSSRTIRHPLEKMEEVGDQFDNLTYQKGGAVLAMFESWLGPENFRSGVHDGASAPLPIPSGACPDWVFPNPDAAGYYRWSLEPPELSKLKAKGKLSPVEKLSLASNVSAAVKSGTLLLGDAMPTLEWLAQDD